MIMSDTKVLRLVKKSENLPEGSFTAKTVAKAEPRPAPITVIKPPQQPKSPKRRKQKERELPRLNREEMIKIFRTMYLSRRLDDKEIQMKGQNRIFFQISGAGHEAILVAAAMCLKPGVDWFYPYYRDRALCLQLGMSPLDMLLSAVGSKNDPNSGGRQMPSHWGVKALNIVSGSSATGMKALHAVGSADASLILDRVTAIADRDANHHSDEVIYVSLGDGTTSEGEFWESVNAACARKLPVLFLIEDNGYAISVPVEVQTAGGDVSKLLRSFPCLHVDSVDGTDFRASLKAMQEAV